MPLRFSGEQLVPCVIKVLAGSKIDFNDACESYQQTFSAEIHPPALFLLAPLFQIVIGGDISQHKTQLFVSLCSTSVIKALRNSIVSVALPTFFIRLHKS